MTVLQRQTTAVATTSTFLFRPEPRDKTAIREREIFIYQSKYTIPVS